MYLCRKCGGEFIDPLGGRCPMCGVRVKPSWEEKQAGEVSLPPGMGEAKPTAESESVIVELSTPEPTRTYRPPEKVQPVDRVGRTFPDTGVYGPPRDYDGPTAPSGGSPRRGVAGIVILSLIITALSGVVALVVFLLSGECDLEEAVGDFTEGFTEGVSKTAENLGPLWRDRAAEMREAGYEPVTGLPPDLWPAAEETLWFVGDDAIIYYEAVKDQELRVLPLPEGTSIIGDIYPAPDGTGIAAVLRTPDGLGVYRLTTGGGLERLLDGEALYERLMKAHSGEEDYVRELSRARSSGELLRQPRFDEAMETLYVAAGPPGKYELWIADLETGDLEPLETYNTNTIPCQVSGGVLYYQHGAQEPGVSALVYARTLDTGNYEFVMTAGNAGGIIGFEVGEDGTVVYLGRDYQDTPVVFYQRPGEAFSENMKVPGDAPESVALGPGGVVVVNGVYEGRDNVFFLNLDHLDAQNVPQIRYWSGISDIRTACLGPPLAAF